MYAIKKNHVGGRMQVERMQAGKRQSNYITNTQNELTEAERGGGVGGKCADLSNFRNESLRLKAKEIGKTHCTVVDKVICHPGTGEQL